MTIKLKNTIESDGYTLLELLIIVAIIGILVAFTIPQYMPYKKKAAVAAAENQIGSCITQALAQYAENGSKYFSCRVGDISMNLAVLEESGSINNISNRTLHIKKMELHCDIRNNRAICY